MGTLSRTLSSTIKGTFEATIPDVPLEDMDPKFERSFTELRNYCKGDIGKRGTEVIQMLEREGHDKTVVHKIRLEFQNLEKELDSHIISAQTKALGRHAQTQVVEWPAEMVRNNRRITCDASTSSYFMTTRLPLGIEPAPTWNTSAEASDPEVSLVPQLRNIKTSRKNSKTRNKDRKTKKPQVPVQIVKADEDGKQPDDGYPWRKYGCKQIKSAKFKKQYFKCNHPCSTSKFCSGKKRVQQANNDPSVLHVTYEVPHTCDVANQRAACKDAQNGIVSCKNDYLGDQISTGSIASQASFVDSDWTLGALRPSSSERFVATTLETARSQDKCVSLDMKREPVLNSATEALPTIYLQTDFQPTADMGNSFIWAASRDEKDLEGAGGFVETPCPDLDVDHQVLLEQMLRYCSPGYHGATPLEMMADISHWQNR